LTAVRQLARELEEAGLRPIVFEEDEATARRLQRRGIPVAYGSVDDQGTFDAFAQASAIVSNGPDDEDAALILSVRARGFEGPIVGLVSAPSHRKPILLAGATAAYTPRHVLAAELCGRSNASISPRAVQLGKLGASGRVFELRVHRDSPIADEPAAQLMNRVEGLRLMARVRDDEVLAPIPAGRILEAGTRVVVVVPEDSRAAVQEQLAPPVTGRPFVVFGAGELALKCRQMLTDVGEETRLVAPEALDQVDLIGDFLDTKTLGEAGVRDAAAVVLAIENDATTLFAATLLRDYAPETPLIAGVESSTNVERTRAAGADYAIALDHVTGRILAHHLLEKRRGDAGFKVEKRRVGALVTAPSSVASILTRTGVVVLGRLSSDADDASLELLADDAEVSSRDFVQVCASPSTLRDYPG
jgi:Trk K+ transport system NAD-binding subunit